MDFDKSLEAVGELGLWHALVLMLLIPAALLPGMWSVLFVFSGYVSKHRYMTSFCFLRSFYNCDTFRCLISGCDDAQSEFKEPWVNFSIPQGSKEWSSCFKYIQKNLTEEVCNEDSFTTEMEECGEFVYDNSVFSSTVVTEFDLVCNGEHGQVDILRNGKDASFL